jgi:hypothetical protein
LGRGIFGCSILGKWRFHSRSILSAIHGFGEGRSRNGRDGGNRVYHRKTVRIDIAKPIYRLFPILRRNTGDGIPLDYRRMARSGPYISLKEAFTSRAPNALVLLIIFLFSVPLSQGLHLLIHKVVLGQSPIVVWGLMIFDALIVVPLIAALNGSALFVGYRSGATWRGWAKTLNGEQGAPLLAPPIAYRESVSE